MLVAWCANGYADPRSIGRAGTTTVSDDGAAALLANPGGMARRDGARVQLGLAFVDDEMSWIAAQSTPVAHDQSSSQLLPQLAIEGSLGCYVVGAALVTTANSERLLRSPTPLGIPPNVYGRSFDYRYAGLGGAFRRDTAVIGIARRLGDTVAAGVSLGLSRVSIGEQRRLWAGDVARDRLADPAHDIELTFDATDNFVPSAAAGVLVAPEDSRVELAASLAWSAPARPHGDVHGIGASSNTEVVVDSSATRVEIEQPVIARTGMRWLGERWIGELGAELWYVPARARATRWILDDVTVVDTTTLGASREAELPSVTSRISSRTHGAVRAAVDVELIAGFLWATAGYAYATAGVAGTRQSPTFGDLGGHTVGAGLEATAGGITVTLGWGRTWSVKSAEPVTRWRFDNPFHTGDAAIPGGTFDGSTDMLGVSIDAELAAPE
jgi:hypothetical protein